MSHLMFQVFSASLPAPVCVVAGRCYTVVSLRQWIKRSLSAIHQFTKQSGSRSLWIPQYEFSGFYLWVLCSKLHLKLQNVFCVAFTLQNSNLCLYEHNMHITIVCLGFSAHKEEDALNSVDSSWSEGGSACASLSFRFYQRFILSLCFAVAPPLVPLGITRLNTRSREIMSLLK